MHSQYYIENKRLELYIPEHKLAIEIDEYGRVDRSFEYARRRQMMIGKRCGCKFIIINPNASDYNINRVIYQVYMHIKQPTIKLTKK